MEERKIIGSTTQCIVCLKEATNHTGHVLKENNIVLAGWCSQHVDAMLTDYDTRDQYLFLMSRTGCFGGWHEKYGFLSEEPLNNEDHGNTTSPPTR